MTYKDLLEHFKDDPEVYKNLQIAITSPHWRDVEETHLCMVLFSAFDWSRVPPSTPYWGKICKDLSINNQ